MVPFGCGYAACEKGEREGFPGRPFQNAKGSRNKKSEREGGKKHASLGFPFGSSFAFRNEYASNIRRKERHPGGGQVFQWGKRERNSSGAGLRRRILGLNPRSTWGKAEDIHFVHLSSVNDAFGIEKDLSFDIRKFPYLTWRWKATRLPKGGDIRKRETDDQAGQIYVLFPKVPRHGQHPFHGIHLGRGDSGRDLRDKHGLQQDEIRGPPERSGKTGPVGLGDAERVRGLQEIFSGRSPQPGQSFSTSIPSEYPRTSGEIYYGDIFFSVQPPKDLK